MILNVVQGQIGLLQSDYRVQIPICQRNTKNIFLIQ